LTGYQTRKETIMLYRAVPKTGDRLSILGFGYMRLPAKKRGSGIDEERAIRQLRHAIDRGVNYVDTAPAYHLGKSEQILGRALADGYREKVRLATKLPPWSVRSRGDMDRILDGQLAALQTDRIDYYLLHSLTRESFLRLKDLGVLEFLDAAKNNGRIVNAGFSTHAPLPAFREMVDAYDWTFCQIQYNYLDEHNQAGTEGLRYAHAKNLAVMVMEPLRGGNLASRVPDEVQAIWDASPVRRSPAAWGLRWVWDHPEVTVVLSGMNDEGHIDANIGTADEGLPGSLTAEEHSRIAQARDAYRRLMKVGCTGCSYCMPCPAGVDIPGCFSLYNDHYLFPANRMARFQYFGRHGGLMGSVSYAGLCRGCGRCEKACPQHLPIRALLNDISREMEPGMRIVIPLLKGGLWCMDQAGNVKRALFRHS
jgi:predicted aldo/keto reductase-like oxidoreductase